MKKAASLNQQQDGLGARARAGADLKSAPKPKQAHQKPATANTNIQVAFAGVSTYSTSHIKTKAHSTSRRNTSGLSSAILSKVCAAFDGERTPCSHACTVLADTPNNAANAAWLIPALLRVAATADSGTTVARAAWPAFISLTDCIKSAWNCSSSLSISHLLRELVQKFGWQVIKLSFGVGNQQPQLAVGGLVVVDDTSPATFAHAITTPAHFTQSACALNHITRQWIISQPSNKGFPFVIAPYFSGISHEYRGFDYGLHGFNILQGSSLIQAQAVSGRANVSHKPLDGIGVGVDNRRAVSLEADEIGVSNNIAGKPLRSGIFMPVHTTVAPSMVGRGGGYFGSVGFYVADTPTPPLPHPLRLASNGGDLVPNIGAYFMPKLARTFLTYSLVAIITLAVERNTPITVIALSIAALVLLQVIGGRDHA
jgi:hypothetical protein